MSKNAHESYAVGLRLSHVALIRNLDRFIAIAESGASGTIHNLGEFVSLYCRFLDVHHESEDRFLFPALRRHSPGRTTDAAHLDRWSSEHRDIDTLGRQLSRVGAHLERDSTLQELAWVSNALRNILDPHVASEERVLSAQHLAEMIPARDLEETLRSIGRANRSHALDMASFLAESVDPDEQKSLFSDAPWIFRRILRLVGQRRMHKFSAFVRTPAIDV